MGCGEFIVKYILFFANLFFALAGLALLGIGVAVQLQISAVTDVIQGAFEGAPISAMVVGGLVFLIAFFGCCGAIKESNCMLVTYSIFMLILMVVKVVIAILIFVKKEDIVADIPRVLNEAFSRDRTAFQSIERAFDCCGPAGAISYLPTVALPNTCCVEGATTCTAINANPGCSSIFQDYLNTFGLVIGVVIICIAAIELVAVVFSLCLANHARNKDRRSRY